MQAQVIRLTRCFITNYNVRYLHSTAVVDAGARWRENNNLPKSNNEFGPLRDNPDYTFKDGRPIPLTASQLFRKKQQINEVKDVIKLMAEVDYAINMDTQNKNEKHKKREEILQEKLKPKGNALDKQS